MIPRYFRCGEPTGRCPLAVSRELVKENEKWVCPCENTNCVDFREPAPFVDGVSGGRSGLVYSGLGALMLLALFLVYLGGGDPCAQRVAELQASLVSLEGDVKALGSDISSSRDGEGGASVSEFAALASKAEAMGSQISQALDRGDETSVNALRQDAAQLASAANRLKQSLDAPISGSGVRITEAKRLTGKLESLESDVEEQLQASLSKCPNQAEPLEELLASVGGVMAQARRLAAPPRQSGDGDDELRVTIDATIRLIADASQQLESFEPAPRLPFEEAEADVKIATAPALLAALAVPLAASWSDTEGVGGTDGAHFIDSPTKGKIFVKPLSTELAFAALATGDIDLYVADRSPSADELRRLGADGAASRSLAEVIALDAVTFLVHPDNPATLFEVENPLASRIAAGSEGSIVLAMARQLGLVVPNGGNLSGEEAAMLDPGVVALGLYHQESKNLRAKRLAVKASQESIPFKPSPFTIATEDYRFSFRIVAWTNSKPSKTALEFVQFATSDTGQQTVEQRGFVDLRLRPIQGDVDPIILAALGEAIGVEQISSATRLSTNIRFSVGEADLDLKAAADLERLPRYVAASYPDHKVVILGFTDSDGGDQINIPLSQRRAETVAEDLRLSKVDSRSAGLGASFSLDTNETEAGKARNRRAEVWVVKP